MTILSRVANDAELAVHVRPLGDRGRERGWPRRGRGSSRDAAERPQPARDDKALAAWNGLAIAAFADAAAALAATDPEAAAGYRDAAERAAGTIVDGLLAADGSLGRSWKDGRAVGSGVLEDYTHLADGLLALYEATFDERWFTTARALMDRVLARFADPAGGFFDTADDHERLVTRPKDVQDNAVPSGNAMAARVLLRLAAWTGEGSYRDAAERAIRSVVPFVDALPDRLRAVAERDGPRARAGRRGRDRRRPGRPGDGGAPRRDAARLPPEPGHRRRRRSRRQRDPAAARAGRRRRPADRLRLSRRSRAGSRSAMRRRCAPSSTPRRPMADAAPGVHDPRGPAGRVRGTRRGDGPGLRRCPRRRRRLPPATPERGAASRAHPGPGRRRCRRPRSRWRGLRPGARRAVRRVGARQRGRLPDARGRSVGRRTGDRPGPGRGLHRPGTRRGPERRGDLHAAVDGRSPTACTRRSGSSGTRAATWSTSRVAGCGRSSSPSRSPLDLGARSSRDRRRPSCCFGRDRPGWRRC